MLKISRIFILIILMNFISLPIANAKAYITGLDLLNRCQQTEKNKENYESGWCVGYFTGLQNTYILIDIHNNKKNPLNYCPPDNITIQQMILITTNYLRSNPEQLHDYGWKLTINALSTAFPCDK